MGWFVEQVKQRKQHDDQNFEDAFYSVAGAILGRRLSESLKQDEIATSAIEEILKYYHYEYQSNGEEPEFETVDEQLDYRLKPFGIMHRQIKLDDAWYTCAVGPILGTLKETGDAIALIPGTIRGYKYYDFKTLKYEKVTKKIAEQIDNEATCFYRPLPARKITVIDLLKFMLSLLSTSDIILYFLMMGISTLMGMVSPKITQILFSNVVESGNTRILIGISIFMVCYSLSQLFFSSYQTLVNQRIGIKQNIIVQAAVMNRIMNLPTRFFKDYGSGELSSRSQYVQTLCSLLYSTIISTSISSVFSLTYLTQVFEFAPELVIPSIAITLSTIIFSLITTFVQSKVSKKQMLISTKESGISYSMITGIQKIKLAGAEKRMFSRWADLYAKSTMLVNNPPSIVKYAPAINLAISSTGTIILYYIAISSKVSVANYYAFNASFGMVSAAFSALASIATTFANIKPTLEMAKPIMDAEPEVSAGKEIITKVSGAIELNNVSFRYTDDMPMVIDNLSLKIKPGEYVAIVGSTGCGKSTLLRLLLGFEKPLKGSIYYDRKDITKVDLQSLRRKIGVVMQDGKLFTGDIYSNIVISAPQLTLDEAWEAAEMASIADDIREMPMGMHTLISEGSGGISGGQKQRLMIARAVAPKPKILMFDEATSALDNITQKNVSDAIDALKCTRIVIAHRLSTIRHCDRIIVLNKGKIEEDGTYEELIKNNGFFAELVERQRLDV